MGIGGETEAVSIKLWPLLNLDSSPSARPLSRWEREKHSAQSDKFSVNGCSITPKMQARFRCRFPLPAGEGEGEGEKLILNWRLLFNLGDYAFDGSFRPAAG